MSDEEKLKRAFAPGWLAQAANEVKQETRAWPDWRKDKLMGTNSQQGVKMICSKHKEYKGLRKPRVICPECWEIWRTKKFPETNLQVPMPKVKSPKEDRRWVWGCNFDNWTWEDGIRCRAGSRKPTTKKLAEVAARKHERTCTIEGTHYCSVWRLEKGQRW